MHLQQAPWPARGSVSITPQERQSTLRGGSIGEFLKRKARFFAGASSSAWRPIFFFTEDRTDGGYPEPRRTFMNDSRFSPLPVPPRQLTMHAREWDYQFP